MAFECDQCGKQFVTPIYEISWERARTEFQAGGNMPEVDISDSESIHTCCSMECRDLARAKMLAEMKIKATYPDIGPVEICSRCGGAVDMTRYHYGYVESVDDVKGENEVMIEIKQKDIEYLAVLCTTCKPA